MSGAAMESTQYGFRWGGAEVTRLASMPDGTVVIGIKGSGKQEIEVYVSPAGRSVRAFCKGHGEMKADRYMGDAGSMCGRGICALGNNHEGRCEA